MPEAQVNNWIIDRFASRTADSKLTFEALRTLLMIFKEGGDLVTKSNTRRLFMDFDFKRRPAAAMEREIKGQPHLAFETRPWNDIAEYDHTRAQWEQFREASGRCLKTVEDLRAFEDFVAGVVLNRGGLKRSTSGGTVKAALRQILRAFVRSKYGLDARQLSFRELAEFLKEGGYEVSESDVKNASRPAARLRANSVPRTEAVMRLTAYVKKKFRDFDEREVLVKL